MADYLLYDYRRPWIGPNGTSGICISNKKDAPYIALYTNKKGRIIGANIDGCDVFQKGDTVTFSKTKQDPYYCKTEIEVDRNGEVIRARKKTLHKEEEVLPGADPTKKEEIADFIKSIKSNL